MNTTSTKSNPLAACYADLKSSMAEDGRKGRQFFGIDGEMRRPIKIVHKATAKKIVVHVSK